MCVYIYIYVCQKRVAANDSKCVGQMYLYCQTSVHTSRSFSGGLITVECSPKFVYPSPLSQKIRANKKPSICHRPHQPNQPSLRLCARLNSSCHPKCARLWKPCEHEISVMKVSWNLVFSGFVPVLTRRSVPCHEFLQSLGSTCTNGFAWWLIMIYQSAFRAAHFDEYEHRPWRHHSSASWGSANGPVLRGFEAWISGISGSSSPLILNESGRSPVWVQSFSVHQDENQSLARCNMPRSTSSQDKGSDRMYRHGFLLTDLSCIANHLSLQTS